MLHTPLKCNLVNVFIPNGFFALWKSVGGYHCLVPTSVLSLFLYLQILHTTTTVLHIAILLSLDACRYLTLTTQASVFVLCLQQLLPLFTTSQIQKIFFSLQM